METKPFTGPKVGMLIRVGGKDGSVCKIVSVQGDGYRHEVINGLYGVEVKPDIEIHTDEEVAF